MNRQTAPELSSAQNRDNQSLNQKFRNWVRRFSRLRFQLILPYVFLTTITALFGIYIVSNYFTRTIQERFNNYMLETSRAAADQMVRHEREHLEALRLLVFTQGVAEAISASDPETLEELLFPIVANEEIQLLTVVDNNGIEVLSLIHDSESDQFARSTGFNLLSLDIVNNAIQGIADEEGDKYTSILELEGQHYFTTIAPVRDSQGEEIGAIIVGSQITSLAIEFKERALAEIIILDAAGNLLETTLAEPDEGFQIVELDSEEVGAFENSFSKNLAIYGRDFRVTYSPLIARSENLGFLAVILPMNYIITSSFNSRILLSVIFTVSTIGVIIVGNIIARRLIKPITQLRDVTMQVAAGDLSKKTRLRRSDEIGQLALVFDSMTSRLIKRKREAEKMYSDLELRAQEISEAHTKLQNSQLQLVQSEKLSSIGQLIAGLVHDVKNPLGVITFAAAELQQMLPGDANSDEYFSIVNSSTAKVDTIISDLLKFARQSEPEKSVQDLIETINIAIRLTDYQRKQSGIELELLNLPASLMCNFDARQIESVLLNLINNAIHSMSQGGTLSINVMQTDTIVITIKDTGIGIHPDIIKKIFDPFFTTKPEGESTGLGLSVAYGIISDHGGQIEVDSQLGKGTTFTIRLPAVIDQVVDNGSTRSSKPETDEKSTGPSRSDNRFNLQRFFDGAKNHPG